MDRLLLIALCLLCSPLVHAAEAFPSRPVRIVVPYAPGGAPDIIGRVIAQELTTQTGNAFVVENRTGAGGIVGYNMAAKAAPDGYTIAMADPSLVILPRLHKSLPFDVSKDFTAVTHIINVPLVLVVPPSLGIGSVKELIGLAQANPGKLNFGSAGNGSLLHLAAELFKAAAKVDIVHVAYKGSGDAIGGLLGGQIQMLFSTVTTMAPQVKSGKLRGLAVTTDSKRSAVLPDIPAMGESGVQGMSVQGWFGIVAPGGVTRDIVSRLNAEFIKAVGTPAVRTQLLAQGGEVIAEGPETMGRLIASDLQRWAAVTKSAGIVPE